MWNHVMGQETFKSDSLRYFTTVPCNIAFFDQTKDLGPSGCQWENGGRVCGLIGLFVRRKMRNLRVVSQKGDMNPVNSAGVCMR